MSSISMLATELQALSSETRRKPPPRHLHSCSTHKRCPRTSSSIYKPDKPNPPSWGWQRCRGPYCSSSHSCLLSHGELASFLRIQTLPRIFALESVKFVLTKSLAYIPLVILLLLRADLHPGGWV
ncbi:unnamed protein product [Peniophora sp. CBMAI 1063]|nr:unnamed protein product [Peniophora sp. CBMAI 1063]